MLTMCVELLNALQVLTHSEVKRFTLEKYEMSLT